MSLKSDIENAFLKSMGNPKEKGNIPELAKDLTDAITNFLTKQEFRVSKLESEVDIDKIETGAALTADIGKPFQGQTPSWPGGVAGAPQPVVITPTPKVISIPALKLDKTFGQGGALTVKGKSVVNTSTGGQRAEGLAKKSVVKLFKNEIKGDK